MSSLQEGQKVALSTGANTPSTNQETNENSSQESPEGHETKDTAPEETADKRKVRAHIPHIFSGFLHLAQAQFRKKEKPLCVVVQIRDKL